MNSKVIIILVAFIFFSSCKHENSNGTNSKTKNVLEKVLETGKIRAAYTLYPPGCMQNKETGELYGIFVETIEKVGQEMNLEIEWVEPVGWGTQIEGLNNDRYDILGSSVWANPKRAKFAYLSDPLYYSPISVFVRKDENRWNDIESWSILNDSDIKISTIDGGTGEVIVRNNFPKATTIPLPQMTEFSQSFMDVVHKKADLLLLEPYYGFKFLESNPNSIKDISKGKPLRMFGNCYMIKQGEDELQKAINVIVEDLHNSGFIEDLVKKYEEYPNTIVRVSKPYIIN